MTEASTMKAYVMCGVPGSGKSTFTDKLVQEHSGNACVISGDAIREELYGDENIQGNYSEIAARMEEMVSENIGKVLIMDSTHYRSAYRKSALTLLQSYGYTDVELVVVDRPLEVCLKQNASRRRKVPTYVIERMFSSLVASVSQVGNEGFSRVSFV